MSSLEGVPVKMPRGVLQEAKEGAGLVTALEIRVPDYLAMLRDTEYEFSLENWVLTGLQGGYPCQPRAFTPRSPSEVLPSCPPYWLMFSSPQQSRLASRHSSDFWEPNPRQRSRSLNPAVLRAAAKFTVSDSEDEPEVVCAAEADASSPARLSVHSPLQRKVPIAFTPNLLNPPACLSGPQDDCSRGPRAPTSFTHRPLNARANTVDRVSDVSIQHCKPTNQAPGPFCHSLGIPPVASQPLGSCGLAPDSSVELLSALSPEERELLGAITEQGYPLRTAFIALQKTGQQTPDLILSYLVACRNLCERGYDEDQVEEALEMFQNCETKAEEFLHLLGQFNEMGFQQSAIKEVLLVHENHRERALEELMMRMT